MADPELTARDLYARLVAVLAEARNIIDSKFRTPGTLTFGASSTVAFNGIGGWSEYDTDWVNPIEGPAFLAFGQTVWDDTRPLPDFWFGGTGEGFVLGHAHGFRPGFVFPTPLTWLDASHGLILRSGGVGNAYMWLQSKGNIVITSDTDITVEDGAAGPLNLLDSLVAAAALVEDAAYGAGWNGDTTHAPSQNAVYDKISAMDILIAANTTQAEVEAIILAECAGGESIDNAIDALIAAHAAVAAAHHARYTDAESVTAMGVKGDASPLHHDRYTDAEAATQADNQIAAANVADLADGHDIEDASLYTSDSWAWVPCIVMPHDSYPMAYNANQWRFINNTNPSYARCWLPIPTAKQGLKLYLTGVRVGIFDGDANDYINLIEIKGLAFDGETEIYDSGAITWGNTGAALESDTFNQVDCSGYEMMLVNIRVTLTTATDFKVTSVCLRCHYA